jgi:hypothetical protein
MNATLYLRKNYQKTTLDDSNKVNVQTHQVLKLHSKIKGAWKLLDTINFSLYHSTTAEILQSKPIFDTQKQKLIIIETSIEKIYKCGLTLVLKPLMEMQTIRLDTNTSFPEWNETATVINKLLDKVVDIIANERDLEMGVMLAKAQEMDIYEEKEVKKLVLFDWASLLLWFVLGCFCFAFFILYALNL